MPKQTATIIKAGRRGTGKKEPLKESNYERFLRIRESNARKEKLKSDRAIKKLKKEGKVQSISGFLTWKAETVDDYTQSKLNKFREKRVGGRMSLASSGIGKGRCYGCRMDGVSASTAMSIPPITTSPRDSLVNILDDSDPDDDDALQELLNYRPFHKAGTKSVSSAVPAEKLLQTP